MSDGDQAPPGVGGSPSFSTTNWSLVRAAGKGGDDSPTARLALAELCRAYWYPIYCYLRRSGHRPPDSQDLTQEFFARLIRKRQLEGLESGDRRFRHFLLRTLKHFVSDERKRAKAQRRGGGEIPVSLDDPTAEFRYLKEPSDPADPEVLYQRTWANTLLMKVLGRLRARYAESGKADFYSAMEPLLVGGETEGTLREIGARLGLSEGATKVAAHRLRREFGRVLRQEIAMTVSEPGEVETELRYFVRMLAGR